MYSGVPIVMPICVRLVASVSVSRTNAGEAEIGHLDLARSGDHDVFRLDVAMDHALFGGLAQGGGDLPHDRQCLLQQRRPAAGEPVAEVLSLHVLLDDIVQAVDVPHLVDLHDIGMHQRGGGLGLALEAPEVGLVVRQVRPEDLDRNPTFQVALLGKIDLGHRPSTKAAKKVEIADPPAGEIDRGAGGIRCRASVAHFSFCLSLSLFRRSPSIFSAESLAARYDSPLSSKSVSKPCLEPSRFVKAA